MDKQQLAQLVARMHDAGHINDKEAYYLLWCICKAFGVLTI